MFPVRPWKKARFDRSRLVDTTSSPATMSRARAAIPLLSLSLNAEYAMTVVNSTSPFASSDAFTAVVLLNPSKYISGANPAPTSPKKTRYRNEPWSGFLFGW